MIAKAQTGQTPCRGTDLVGRTYAVVDGVWQSDKFGVKRFVDRQIRAVTVLNGEAMTCSSLGGNSEWRGLKEVLGSEARHEFRPA